MADEQLRGLNINQVYIDEAVDLFEPATNWRTELLAQWMDPIPAWMDPIPARRWWTLAGTPESEITPAKTKEEKPEIKRGNPWVQ